MGSGAETGTVSGPYKDEQPQSALYGRLADSETPSATPDRMTMTVE